MKLNEMEIKIALNSEENFQKIFQTCQSLFGPPLSHIHQLDEYFDTPDRQLKKQDLVLRIRSTDQQKIIALKSPRVALSNGITNRIELEFAAVDGENVVGQLHKQGLDSIESAEKLRWTFIHNACEIVLDKLPFIGSFIEIEGPSEKEIHAIMNLLGLSTFEVIHKNYGELMSSKFKELGLPDSPVFATFENEKKMMILQESFQAK